MIVARRVLLALSAVLAVTLAACGSPPAPPPSPAAPSGGGAFPVTITHRFGNTVIPEEPKRVVSLGYTDQDAILALGVVPVAIREFTGNQPSATWPWAQDELKGQQPVVLNGEIGAETLAALDPDLIVAVSAGLTQAQYDLFSQIAPTISQPAAFVDYGTPWQDATRMIGNALGRAPEAETLVTGLEARFAQVRAQYPVLAGRTVAGTRPSSNDNANFFVWGPQDLRGRFFDSLGMPVPPVFADLAKDAFYASLSTEELGKLDTADAVVLITASAAERATFEALPGYPRLKAVREGRFFVFDDQLSAALSFSSVLSLPEALDRIPPEIAKALEG
ncbi:iron-siderophore ABC transporter substrate-binding protein [Actinomycetes bacterium KLBMP 9759]